MNATRILMAAALLAGVASAAEPKRQFQRAASFHKRVQQYVVHDAHRILASSAEGLNENR